MRADDAPPNRRLPVVLLVLLLAICVATFLRPPAGRTSWLLEVGPGLALVGYRVATYRRAPLSDLVYVGTFVDVEWWTTLVVAGDVGTAFLGSQGDVWDAQWDRSVSRCDARRGLRAPLARAAPEPKVALVASTTAHTQEALFT